MGRYRAGIETETRIIDATRSLLAEGGLEAVTLNAICDRAEVRSGSIYNLFDSKEAIVLRVVREAIAAFDPDPRGEGTDTVGDLVDAYIRFFEEEPQLARVYVLAAVSGGASANGTRQRFLRHHERRVERFADAMQRNGNALTPDEATQQAEILLGALDGLAVRWVLDTDFAFAVSARKAAQQLS